MSRRSKGLRRPVRGTKRATNIKRYKDRNGHEMTAFAQKTCVAQGEIDGTSGQKSAPPGQWQPGRRRQCPPHEREVCRADGSVWTICRRGGATGRAGRCRNVEAECRDGAERLALRTGHGDRAVRPARPHAWCFRE